MSGSGSAESEETAAPFATSRQIGLDVSVLPLYADRDALFDIQADGVESFSNVNTVDSTFDPALVDPASEDGTDGAVIEDVDGTEAAELLDVANTVVIDQTYNSADDWVISQSVSNSWGTPEASADTDAAESPDDSVDPDADEEAAEASAEAAVDGSGSESYSITIINGTTTITSYSLHESFSIGGEDADAIPAEWITAASASVNDEDDSETPDDGVVVEFDADAAEDDTATDGDVAATDDDTVAEEPKMGFKASADFDTTITETKITLDDGQPGIQRTVTISWSASFSWHHGGTFDLTALPDETDSDTDDSEDSELTTYTTDSTTATDTSAVASDSGPDFEHTFTYNAFASGSIAGSFSVTTVAPTSGVLAHGLALLTGNASVDFGFAMSAMAGGGSSSKLKIQENSSSGDVASETDEHYELDVLHETSSSNFTGFSFALGNADDDSVDDTTADDDVAVTYDSAESPDSDTAAGDGVSEFVVEPDAGSTNEAQVPRPQAGQQSAIDQVTDGVSGVEFSFDTNSSSSTTKDITFREKTRVSNSFNSGHHYSAVSLVDNSTTTSDSHASIAFGGDSTRIDIGSASSGDHSVEFSDTKWNTEPYDTTDQNDWTHWVVDLYSSVGESSSEFGFALGDVDAAGLTNESSWRIAEMSATEQHEDWLSGYSNVATERRIYRNNSDNDGTAPETPSDEDPIFLHTWQYSADGEITVQAEYIPSISDFLGHSDEDSAEKTPEELTSEYTERKLTIARLQLAIDEETDPGMQKYYQDQLDIENEILDNLRQSALDAGVEQTTLDDIDTSAVTTLGSVTPLTDQDNDGSPTAAFQQDGIPPKDWGEIPAEEFYALAQIFAELHDTGELSQESQELLQALTDFYGEGVIRDEYATAFGFDPYTLNPEPVEDPEEDPEPDQNPVEEPVDEPEEDPDPVDDPGEDPEPISPEPGESNGLSSELDALQGTLDVLGLFPGLGIVPDAANTLISLGRGDLPSAGLNFLAMIPLLGQGTKGAQLGGKLLKLIPGCFVSGTQVVVGLEQPSETIVVPEFSTTDVPDGFTTTSTSSFSDSHYAAGAFLVGVALTLNGRDKSRRRLKRLASRSPKE